MLRRIIVTSATAVLVAGASWAQDDQSDADETTRLDDITVTASPLGPSAKDLAVPVGVLTGDRLYLRNNGGTLGEVLEGELGVSSTYHGPVASRPVIRGQQGPRVRVLQDRIGSLDVSDVSPDHAVTVEPLFAKQIEIIRGPATLLFGSGAEGGIANVVTHRIHETLPDDTVTGAVEVRGDSAAEEEAYLGELDLTFGQFVFHGDILSRETEDVDIDGFATRTSIRNAAAEAGEPIEEEKGELANSDSDTDAYTLGVSWVGDWGFVGAAYSRYEADYGLPGPGEEEEEEEEEEEGSGGPTIDMEQDRFDVKGRYTALGGPWRSISFDFGINDYEHQEIEPNGEVATDFDNDEWEGRIEAVHEAGDWHGAIGLQLLDRDFSAEGEEAFVPQTDTQSWALFALQERHFNGWRMALSGRFEDLENDPDNDPDTNLEDYEEQAYSGALGFVWDLGQESLARLNISYTERHPKPEELYSDGAHLATGLFEIGDDTLDRERNWSVDVGFRDTEGDLRWSIATFYKAANDYIYLQKNGEEEDGLPVAEYLQDDAIFYGYEADLEFPILATRFGQFHGRLWSDYVVGELDETRDVNEDLPRIPAQRYALALGLDGKGYQANVESIFYRAQDANADFELETGGWTQLDADLLVDLPVWRLNTKLFVRGTNLLDERGRRHASFLKDFAPIPGISVHAGLRAFFQ